LVDKKEFEKEFEKVKKFLEDKNFVIADETLKAVLASIAENLPVFLVGPTRKDYRQGWYFH
jgi:MoxR-like ATPase